MKLLRVLFYTPPLLLICVAGWAVAALYNVFVFFARRLDDCDGWLQRQFDSAFKEWKK